MRLLADENVDRIIVLWLRERGHDVFYAAESAASAPDDTLIRLARQESRVLITADLDFGELIFRQSLVTEGVVLMRFRAASPFDRLRLLQSHWPVIESRASGHFIVLRDKRARIRPIRGSQTN